MRKILKGTLKLLPDRGTINPSSIQVKTCKDKLLNVWKGCSGCEEESGGIL